MRNPILIDLRSIYSTPTRNQQETEREREREREGERQIHKERERERERERTRERESTPTIRRENDTGRKPTQKHRKRHRNTGGMGYSHTGKPVAWVYPRCLVVAIVLVALLSRFTLLILIEIARMDPTSLACHDHQ
jgi:hypothetical protein